MGPSERSFSLARLLYEVIFAPGLVAVLLVPRGGGSQASTTPRIPPD